MTENVSAYPLQWPAGRPRRSQRQRKPGTFSTVMHSTVSSSGKRKPTALTVADARKRLSDELDRMGARYPVISSNVELRLDGAPRSGQPEPSDPGIAVYFQLAGKPICMPCDTYLRVADNIAAVAAHIAATRAIERHGVASLSEMFAGFQALPSPETERPWRQVLELHREARVTLEMVEAKYRALARERHPDVAGGGHAMMAELNSAREAAKRELGGCAS